MSEAQKLLQEIRDMKEDLYQSGFEERDRTIRAVDHGHGYITLQIPANQVARERRRKQIQEYKQKAQ